MRKNLETQNSFWSWNNFFLLLRKIDTVKIKMPNLMANEN